MIKIPESKENNRWTLSYVITPPGIFMMQVHLTASVDLEGLNLVMSWEELPSGISQIEFARHELSA